MAGLRSLGRSYFGHGLQLILKIGSSLILTRLLAPEVYGIFGPALAVTFFLEFLADIGLRPAIGRSPNGESPEFLGTAWTIVQIRAVFLAAATGGLTLLLPGFYEKPALMPVLAVLVLRPFILAWHNPTLYVLYRRLNYRPGFILDVTQTVVAVPITILLAVWLQDVWSLVLGLLIGDVYRLVPAPVAVA